MFKYKKIILGVVALAVFAGAALVYVASSRADSLPWGKDYTAALATAKAHNKPVITYLFTDWCTYCKQMESTTFQDSALIEKMSPRYVWVKLNAETDPEGARLKEEFGVAGYPTIVLLDPAGEEIDRTEGFLAADKFQEVFDFFQTSPTAFGRLKEAAEQSPTSVAAQYALGEKYLERNDFLDAAKRFAIVIGRDAENSSDLVPASYYFLAFALASGGQQEEAFRQLATLKERFPESRLLADAAVLEGQMYYYGGETGKARQVFESYLEKFPGHGYNQWVSQLLKEETAEKKAPPSTTPALARSH